MASHMEVKEDIPLPQPLSELDGPQIEELDLEEWEGENRFAIVVHNVYTHEECQALIDRSESKGYEAALVNIGGGRQMAMGDVRSSDRCIIDDPSFAEELFQRIRKITNDDPRILYPEWAPTTKTGRFRAVGLNERLRFLRYDKGNFFASHMDGTYFRGNEAGEERAGERSLVTCQLYLNEGFEGGATRFESYDSTKGFDVIPKTGSVLLFEHRLNHEGSLLIDGRKYAIRTDVMYTNKGEGHEYSVKPIVLQNNP
jgi:hypothetical protein